MSEQLAYQLAADALLILHALLVAFVVFGLALVLIGRFRKWQWVRNPWFRIVHLVTIGIVTLQAWLGVICPLTNWEMALREKAGDVVYTGSFIEHWLHRLIFFEAEAWMFTLTYSLFGLTVIASWFFCPPRTLLFKGSKSNNTG